jgi:hypothetical protein
MGEAFTNRRYDSKSVGLSVFSVVYSVHLRREDVKCHTRQPHIKRRSSAGL